MPQETVVYKLFIAAPSDVNNEKEIIRKTTIQWNKIMGKNHSVTVQVVDWNNAYPLFGKSPQANIDKQVLDKADIVVAIFWTKFGEPNAVAPSPTEGEILRAHSQNKPLLLYFSDKPVPPSSMKEEQYKRIMDFRERYQDSSLYKIVKNEQEFEDAFLDNFNDLMHDILTDEIIGQDEINEAIKISNILAEEDKKNASTYRETTKIKELIDTNFNLYFQDLYGVSPSNSKNTAQIDDLRKSIEEWGTRVAMDCQHLQKVFSKIESYSDDEFKNEIFAKELWTVKGALENKGDRDLDDYRRMFRKTDDLKIKETVRTIMTASSEYSDKPPLNVANQQISKPVDFGFDFFSKHETLITYTIGKGIRSEILYKLHPEYFPLMTRRSIWGLYFLTSCSAEFVVNEEKKGISRTIHNWEYVYDRFAYYNHLIYNLLSSLLKKYGIELNPKLKYGYVNSFLVDIWKKHSDEIEELKTPQNVH